MIVTFWESQLGRMYLACEAERITHVGFAGQLHEPELIHTATHGDAPVLSAGIAWLERYFTGADPGEPPPLAPQGTAFQNAVWELLRAIPYAKSVTYGDIAAAIAKRHGLARMSSQAVGQAVGRNPIAIMIPCHRVLGADGGLTGYAGGIARKRALLALEGIAFKER